MKRALLLAALFLIAAPLTAQEGEPLPVAVTYTLDATQPKSGTVKVEMLVENNRDDEVTVGIPVWAPGSYRVVSYYLGVQELEAEVDGKKVDVEKTDFKSMWKVKTGRQPRFKVRYALKPNAVFALRGHLTEDHYDLQGPSAWLFIKDRMDGPHRVSFKLPEGWKVGTGLKPLGSGVYGERDYDTFIDCPVELGKFSLYTFEQDKVTYELVVHTPEEIAIDKLIDIHRKFVSEQTRIFGGAPFDRYVFLYHFRKLMGGEGLEHLNSTSITYSIKDMKEDPRHVASIASHEFFHLWNVKRIRPKELGPFDYTRPVRTKALWFSEGVTSYYGDLTLARAGVWTRGEYLSHLGEEVTYLQFTRARRTQTVEEASWTVWDRSLFDSTGSVDYYGKGELLAWLIDLKIRQATGGRKSFDDVMRHLYRTCVVEPAQAGRGPIGVGFEEGGILKAVNEVSGTDFTGFFSRYVSGKDELPYGEVIREAGLSIEQRKALPLDLHDMRVLYPPLPGSPAKLEDVRRGDRVVKVGDAEVASLDDIEKALDTLKAGDRVTVLVSRKGEATALRKELPVQDGRFVIGLVSAPSEAQNSLLRGWLAPTK